MKPEPCDSCSETPCEIGNGCPTYAAGDDPCDFEDPSEPDGDYRAWGPEP